MTRVSLGCLICATLLACGGVETTPALSSPPASTQPNGGATASSESVASARPRFAAGIDVSDHSGAVDWAQVAKTGVTFAFAKATEGVDLADTMFDSHWQALAETDILRGAYHFYVTEDDPVEQARFFIETVNLRPGDLAPAVDIELIGHDTAPGLASRLEIYLEALEAHYGVRPILYTSSKFWDAHLTSAFGDYPLWIAEYEVEEPTIPNGWTSWDLWQWRGDAEVDGVENTADLSRANASRDDWGRLVIPAI